MFFLWVNYKYVRILFITRSETPRDFKYDCAKNLYLLILDAMFRLLNSAWKIDEYTKE